MADESTVLVSLDSEFTAFTDVMLLPTRPYSAEVTRDDIGRVLGGCARTLRKRGT